jgi:hypothetical protein
MVAFLERLPKAVLERAATKGAPDAGKAGFNRRSQTQPAFGIGKNKSM